jgi:superfamily I DNA and/or RNA helicase
MHDLGGICNEVYFDNAISYIQKKVNSPIFYVFSDDLEWCKEKFDHRGDFYFIEGNKNEPLEDLRLMMSCKHAIISNSTFSWWAAWLIKNMNKKIVTPSVWNKQNTKIIDKLIPENWHKLVVI